jgi:methylmalonyl-CoA mutase
MPNRKIHLELETGRSTPANTLRFITATSLFDGHDVSINIIRRILQSLGAEVIHLGHNRSVEEIVEAAIQEDVHGIAISSYQGGHVEYFKYIVDLLRTRDSSTIKVFGGGGGVITADEIRELHAYGIEQIYSPADGQTMGLHGMVRDMLTRADLSKVVPTSLEGLAQGSYRDLARIITALEAGTLPPQQHRELLQLGATKNPPIVGITGTGGAGKSSLTDELICRFLLDQGNLPIALLAVDPSRRRTGGGLLGDRIRMNAISGRKVYMRSLATRGSGTEVALCLPDTITACRAAGFSLILVETSGIGQGDSAITNCVDYSVYVMTPEYGAGTQLEKINMLDFADLVAINKFDRKGAADALRNVSKQIQRNRQAFNQQLDEMPVYGTIASHFNDDGVTALYHGLLELIRQSGKGSWFSNLVRPSGHTSTSRMATVPPERQRYLAEVASTIREYHKKSAEQVQLVRENQHLTQTARLLRESNVDATVVALVDKLACSRREVIDPRVRKLLEIWPKIKENYARDEYIVKIRQNELRTKIASTSLSGRRIPKVALPRFEDHGELLRWLLRENVPGSFPYTGGVFAFKRENEDPTRMFAGEGDAFASNARFKYLSRHSEAKRLSTAFDSVTLYGFDPEERPDIYGKIGNSGVSIATLDDMKVLYEGFNLCDPLTSVSMTINGPAPILLAMFFNVALAQQLEQFELDNARSPTDEEIEQIWEWVCENVRGTVQADILKEDQGQNTCIFSTEFALKMMGDIQEWFITNRVRNFYSVSISGYHIAEAGANPVSQLAFTLANGFTYVESYLARGMHIDDFAQNLSFFFSNGMDPEYSVIGRVARRIWAVAMRFKYGANERGQKLKYHIQTSGRSLHAQEMDFNDIRTTLQALIAVYDHCNSLHTNAHDEAFTTPTPDSVRRALAIQMIINREWGLAKNENPNQGSFLIEELTDLVEEAVLQEFERLAERGGVLGAMETGYQRGKIQDESLYYETIKHSGEYPIVGVNTFINPNPSERQERLLLRRSTDDEKQNQIYRLREFQKSHSGDSPSMLDKLKKTALENGNIFSVLVEAVRVCSLGQITHALFEVGGRYRRNM